MAQNDTHLVWIDMEMSGLEPDTDRVLEVALIVTDKDLTLLEEGPSPQKPPWNTSIPCLDILDRGSEGPTFPKES